MSKKERIRAKDNIKFEKEVNISNILKTLRVLKKGLMTKTEWTKKYTLHSALKFESEDSDDSSQDDQNKP